MSKPMRIVFAGTPEFAAVSLQAILDAGHEVVAVYCQPDRAAGRGKKIQYGPVKQLALAYQIPVEQPLHFKDSQAVSRLASYQPDVMIVVAYGLLLPEPVLAVPERGCINIHGSILPRWRGAAPIQRAIEAGDSETGITIMQMDKGLDTGAMLLQESLPIHPQMTGGELHDALAVLGGQAICRWLASPDDFVPEAQDDSLACYATKLNKAEAEIDWTRAASDIERQIRAFNPWPVSFTFSGSQRLRVWQAELLAQSVDGEPGQISQIGKHGIDVICGDGSQLRLTVCQPDNSRRMPVADLLNSKADWFQPGSKLGKS